MHCNDAPGAITRLDDMGIAPFLISSSVILTCAQRLMRRICSHCKEPVTYPAKMYQDLNIDPSMFDGVTLFRGRGCDRCKNTTKYYISWDIGAYPASVNEVKGTVLQGFHQVNIPAMNIFTSSQY